MQEERKEEIGNRKEEVGKRGWIDRLSGGVIQYRLNSKI